MDAGSLFAPCTCPLYHHTWASLQPHEAADLGVLRALAGHGPGTSQRGFSSGTRPQCEAPRAHAGCSAGGAPELQPPFTASACVLCISSGAGTALSRSGLTVRSLGGSWWGPPSCDRGVTGFSVRSRLFPCQSELQGQTAQPSPHGRHRNTDAEKPGSLLRVWRRH